MSRYRIRSHTQCAFRKCQVAKNENVARIKDSFDEKENKNICKFLTMSRHETKQCSINSSFLPLTVEVCFFTSSSSPASSPHSTDSFAFSHRNHYHTTSALVFTKWRKKSKTQNMGQTDIFLFIAESKWVEHTQRQRELIVPKKENQHSEDERESHRMLRLGRTESSPSRSLSFMERKKLESKRNNVRVTAADCRHWLLYIHISPPWH